MIKTEFFVEYDQLKTKIGYAYNLLNAMRDLVNRIATSVQGKETTVYVRKYRCFVEPSGVGIVRATFVLIYDLS